RSISTRNRVHTTPRLINSSANRSERSEASRLATRSPQLESGSSPLTTTASTAPATQLPAAVGSIPHLPKTAPKAWLGSGRIGTGSARRGIVILRRNARTANILPEVDQHDAKRWGEIETARMAGGSRKALPRDQRRGRAHLGRGANAAVDDDRPPNR